MCPKSSSKLMCVSIVLGLLIVLSQGSMQRSAVKDNVNVSRRHCCLQRLMNPFQDVITWFVEDAAFHQDSVDVSGRYHKYQTLCVSKRNIPKPILTPRGVWTWISVWVHEANGYYLHFYRHKLQNVHHWRICVNQTRTIHKANGSIHKLPASLTICFPKLMPIYYVTAREMAELIEWRCSVIGEMPFRQSTNQTVTVNQEMNMMGMILKLASTASRTLNVDAANLMVNWKFYFIRAIRCRLRGDHNKMQCQHNYKMIQ